MAAWRSNACWYLCADSWPSWRALRRPNLHVRTGDAAAYVADRVRRGAQPLDMVFLDAFDGDDNVPETLCSPGAWSLASLLDGNGTGIAPML